MARMFKRSLTVDDVTRTEGGGLAGILGLTAPRRIRGNRILRHLVSHQSLPNAQVLYAVAPLILAGQRPPVRRRMPSQPVSHPTLHLRLRLRYMSA